MYRVLNTSANVIQQFIICEVINVSHKEMQLRSALKSQYISQLDFLHFMTVKPFITIISIISYLQKEEQQAYS